MSWQAQTAVTYNSKQKNLELFKLLMYLAEKADSEGVIDPAPGQGTMAEFCKYSDRTVRSHLKELIGSGELIQTRVGSGPGNPSAYKITLPLTVVAESTDDKGGRKAEVSMGNASAFMQAIGELQAQIEELKAEVKSMKTSTFAGKVEKVEAKGGKGGSERWKDLNEFGADDPSLDPYFDPEEEEREAPIPPTAVQIWQRVTGNWPGELRVGIITEGMGPNPDEDALRRAHRLWIGRGYSPINIDGILEWYQQCRASPNWQPNGKHPNGKQPADNPFANDVSNGKGW